MAVEYQRGENTNKSLMRFAIKMLFLTILVSVQEKYLPIIIKPNRSRDRDALQKLNFNNNSSDSLTELLVVFTIP